MIIKHFSDILTDTFPIIFAILRTHSYISGMDRIRNTIQITTSSCPTAGTKFKPPVQKSGWNQTIIITSR